ncbi:hypothetical protein AgCh_013844 [Apium graveolens]
MKKNKLLLCFRPLTDDRHDPIDTHHRDSNTLLLSKYKSDASSKLKSDQESLRITRRRSRSLNASSGNFCNDVKSVLVEASMQQQKQRSFEANAAPPILRSKSHHGSIYPSKSLARVGSAEDRSVPRLSSSISEGERRTLTPFSQIDRLPKSAVHAEAKFKSSNSGLVIFAMSLCATIFCGRVCAILFTLIFFYCMPRGTCVKRLRSVLKLPEETGQGIQKESYNGRAA